MESKFKFFALGIVAIDKPVDTWEVEVYPTELYPNIEGDGDLSATTKITSKLKDPDDVDLTAEVTKANTITAVWLPDMNNRASAPDVCKGETVALFRYAGNDTFYWKLIDFQPNYRKRESVVYYFSNQEKIATEDSDPKELLENGYYIKIDTRSKEVKLHTATNDNEKVGYDLTLDTANGKLSITDTAENSITLDSDKGDLIVNTKNDINVTNKNKVVMNFKGIELHNESDELITVLEELLDAILNEKHIGNMGGLTMLDSSSQQKYTEIKQKITKFKG